MWVTPPVLFLFVQLLFLVVDEHDEEADGQQPAGQPDRPRAPMEGGYAADTRAQREQSSTTPKYVSALRSISLSFVWK